MKSNKWIINLLRAIWVIFLLNNEFFIFWNSAKKCLDWSSSSSLISTTDNKNGRFMLVGDPQMTDDKSYNRHAVIMSLSKFYSDLYMKRNYKHLVRMLQPSDVFILGDLTDNGREWDDDFYDKEVGRFHKIFKNNNVGDKNKPIQHYMVGNHDIGFGNGAKLALRERFEKYFGETSYILETNTGYSFIVIDTVSLSSDDPATRNAALEVLKGPLPATPRILMTHVPLYRTADISCGPNRQKKNSIIRDEYGYQYQNLVSKELSDYILDKVKPIAVFSGDDHDYCKVSHPLGEREATEITVPTFSMAQGVKYPGVILLNLQDNKTLSSELCWLPSQIDIFIRYGYLFVFTLTVLIGYHAIQYIGNRKRGGGYSHLAKEELGVSSSGSASSAPLSLRRCIYSCINSIKDVAIVGIITYIICIIFF